MTSSVIAAQGPNNSLVFYWQAIGSTTWNPVQAVAGPGTTFSAPSVAQVGNSSVIAAQGPAEAAEGSGSSRGASMARCRWFPNGGEIGYGYGQASGSSSSAHHRISTGART